MEAKLVTTSDTIYGTGSITKQFAGTAVGSLVEDGKLNWETPIRQILPSFDSTMPGMNENLIVLDLLSHRHDIAGSNDLWTGSSCVLLLDKKETIPTFNCFGAVKQFRQQFQYNNWGYAMMGEVIEETTGSTSTTAKRNLYSLQKKPKSVRNKLEGRWFSNPFWPLSRSYPLSPVT